MCGGVIPEDHRHLLNLYERHIVCACESCFALRSGDPDLRPVGQRTVWLEGFELPDDIWASFSIPIGLAFFMYSSVTDCVVALYPSPGGATESELHFDSWSRLRELNPVLDDLEPDAEALIVNRMGDPAAYAIAPIDRCYMLVGLVKTKLGGDLRRSGRRARDRGASSTSCARRRWRRDDVDRGPAARARGRAPRPAVRGPRR